MLNTLVTSTYINNVLTVGAGEDGLWHFNMTASYGNLYNCAVYCVMKRVRASAPDLWFAQGYMTYPGAAFGGLADAGTMSRDVVQLQVGDQVSIYTVWIAPGGGTRQIAQNNALPAPTTAPQFTGYLVSRHLV